MPTVDFLPFAVGGAANVEAQAAYAAEAALLANGFQSGVAPSAKFNKALRQSSIMAAVLANYIAQRTGQDVIDNGTTETILTNLAAATPPGFSKLAVVSASGNWTVPAGVFLLDVELWGGGGGGGGSGSGGGTAGGGGGGGYARGIFSVTPGQVIACTIGAAGSGGATGGAVAGAGGGTTSFGAMISATGGGGGQVNPSGNAGNGGTGAGGAINITSSAGSTGAASNVQGGQGASAAFGGGGGGGAQGAAGGGAVPGGGGGGGGTSSAGGSGARGQIHVRY